MCLRQLMNVHRNVYTQYVHWYMLNWIFTIFVLGGARCGTVQFCLPNWFEFTMLFGYFIFVCAFDFFCFFSPLLQCKRLVTTFDFTTLDNQLICVLSFDLFVQNGLHGFRCLTLDTFRASRCAVLLSAYDKHICVHFRVR